MTGLIMAIGIWCGYPVNGPGWNGNILKENVDQCRQELLVCTQKSPNGNGFIDCFKKQKLNK